MHYVILRHDSWSCLCTLMSSSSHTTAAFHESEAGHSNRSKGLLMSAASQLLGDHCLSKPDSPQFILLQKRKGQRRCQENHTTEKGVRDKLDLEAKLGTSTVRLERTLIAQ